MSALTVVVKHEYLSGMTSPVSATSAVARVRAWRVANDWAPYRFATEAGVAEATLRDMDADEWNPTLRTLEKLEALIPKGWRAGDAVPAAKKARAA